MARIYDVVCPNCGEIYQWCKYDEPIFECEKCGFIMAQKQDENSKDFNQNYIYEWKPEVLVFGCGSTSEQVRKASERIKADFDSQQPEKVNFN